MSKTIQINPLNTEQPSLDKDKYKAYKVKLLVNGSINTIYVFNGKKTNEEKEELFKKIFSDKELEQINTEKISVNFSEEYIHFDDSIGTIKAKIFIELKKNISLDEIYLYCQKVETLNSVSVYQSLTQNKKNQLTKIILDQFISNIVSDESGEKFKKPEEEKEVYTFDDIFEMKFDNKKYIVNKALGQKFFIVENEYPFVCNPYDVKEYDTYFEKSTRKPLTNLNSHLLLNNGDIIDNSIYLCLAEDVLSYLGTKEPLVSEQISVKIYFPFLYNKNINNLDDLKEKRENLVQSNKTIINDKTLESFNTINMFYDVYYSKKSDLKYVNKGIKYIKAVVEPEFDVKIPLEIIFKIVHATKDCPLIKYNPSTRQENVYRLYADKISSDGRKIPYLKKANIFKLIKNIGRTKSVAVYIETTSNEQSLICEFDENGYITIYSEFNTVVGVDKIDAIFRDLINPIIDDISNVLEQSGYKLKKFSSLKDTNVEIQQMTYETQIEIKKSLDIDSYKRCISSIFIDETNAFKGKTTNLRFKRVSNYDKFTSQEAHVIQMIAAQSLRVDEIVESLLKNFDLDKNQATELVQKMVNQLQVERGVRKTDIKIKNNPGFKTIITTEKAMGSTTITITTENINNINYLYTLPIYLDTMVRLTQDKNSTNYDVKKIKKICSENNKHKEEIIIPDISPTEESVSKSEESSIKDRQDGRLKTQGTGAISLFFGDDDDEDYDEDGEDGDENDNSDELEGGEKTSDSEPSIESEPDEKLSSISTLTSEESDEKKFDEDKSVVEEPVVEEPVNKQANKSGGEGSDEDGEESDEEESVNKQANKEANKSDEPNEEPDEESYNNIKLKKPYYFQTLIEKSDPKLIVKDSGRGFNSYVRTCSSTARKQPVVLTDEQLDKINKEKPGFLREEDVIKYGSDKDHQHNYICPRYWCLKNNTIVDPEDLKEVIGKDGKKELMHPTCGKVLPKKANKTKPGYYIYEFYEPKPGKKDSKKYPGLIPDSHPDGLCVPCCFTNYNTEGRIKANEKCYKNKDDKNEEKNEEKKEKDLNEYLNDAYIIGPEKFPLEKGRWGYLPTEMQIMLKEFNVDCQISQTNANLKEKPPCLLRHGIEINNKQSFIACISDALFFSKQLRDENNKLTNKYAKILNVKEMRDKIIRSLTIDAFIKFQNGNLVIDFSDMKKEINVNKYNNVKIFSKLDMNKSADKAYATKVISAFENFIQYLQDDDAIIDHTYLWDIVSMPNNYLFSEGVNLVIFNLPDDDITNNVELLCPTNHYSNEFYQARKPTIILMKKGPYYEPIYSYIKNEKGFPLIVKEYKELNPHLSKTMKTVFKEIIKPFFNRVCRPLDSMRNVYNNVYKNEKTITIA